MKFLSLFVMFFLVFNIVSMILTNIKYSKISDLSITEQFFSGRNFSSDIVEKLFLQKIQGNKQHKKTNESKKKNNKENCFLLTDKIVTILSSTNIISNIFLSTNIAYTQTCLDKEINYPLKIPFWQLIFLLLILKILFNVLPRSISINYNKKNIERACIV
ncbi:MAG: hypothetical protein IKN42_04415 [Elusimicrobia bacterium]|nr:hypothetical protein [Elusimicrobiota bacterium]